MKILAVVVYRVDSDSESKQPQAAPVRLAHTYDLSNFSFFQRGIVAESLMFGTRTVAQRTSAGVRQSVNIKQPSDADNYVCHVYHQASNHLVVCMVCDPEYPERTAHALLIRTLAEFEKSSATEPWQTIRQDRDHQPLWLAQNLQGWQDPTNVDKLAKIQKNLDEITDIMHKNIQEVMNRGESLDSLLLQSEDLSNSSRLFYKRAKDHNRCCKLF